MRGTTRRAFLGMIAVVLFGAPRWSRERLRPDNGDEIVIVNGWILRRADLETGADDR